MSTKICNKCGEEKELSEFYKCQGNKDGLHNHCKTCDKNRRKIQYEEMKSREKLQITHKSCNICKELKHRDEFHVANTSLDGLNKICKRCASLKSVELWKKQTTKIENYKQKIIKVEEVVDRIKDRKIELIEYVGATNKKSKWKCLVCQDIWKAAASHIFSGKGCPNCSGNKRHTVDNINERIKDRLIILIKFGGNKKNPSLWKCKICDKEFLNTSGHILNRQQGCPNCFSNSKGEDNIKLILEEYDIEHLCPKLNLHKIAKKTNKVIVDFYFTKGNDKYIIEYHGKQHYEFCKRFHKTEEDFFRQLNRDKVLIEYCELCNINYIEFNDKFPVKEMKRILDIYLKG